MLADIPRLIFCRSSGVLREYAACITLSCKNRYAVISPPTVIGDGDGDVDTDDDSDEDEGDNNDDEDPDDGVDPIR